MDNTIRVQKTDIKPKKPAAKRCRCNHCPHGPDTEVPDQVHSLFESFCGIGEVDAAGSFRSAFVFPSFSRTDEKVGDWAECKKVVALMQWRRLKAA